MRAVALFGVSLAGAKSGSEIFVVWFAVSDWVNALAGACKGVFRRVRRAVTVFERAAASARILVQEWSRSRAIDFLNQIASASAIVWIERPIYTCAGSLDIAGACACQRVERGLVGRAVALLGVFCAGAVGGTKILLVGAATDKCANAIARAVILVIRRNVEIAAS